MRLTVVVCVRPPAVPVIVTVAEPVAAVEVAVSVSVVVLVAGFGLNAAVTPLGKPDAVKLTLPLKPPVGVTVMVLLLFPPCAIVRAAGAAARVYPVVTCPLRVTASTTTFRLFGNVRLFTVLLLFRANA